MSYSLQIQSVIYRNEKKSLYKAIDSIANAIRVNKKTTKELNNVVLTYGDASADPVFSEEEITNITKKFEDDFEFKYVFFNENTGSARGHNKLGAMCKADFMQIMNPDVILCPRFFSMMLKPFSDETLLAGITEARQTPVEHPKDYDRKTLETGWATTACALFRTEDFNKIGGFDEKSFFMYCDDLDFSWQMRLLGKKIYYRPDCIVFHAKTLNANGTWNPTSAEVYYSAEAALLLAYKWSNEEKCRQIYNTYINSEDENLHKAAQHFDELRRTDRLPKQLDPEHKIAEFIGSYYTVHRFPL